MQPPSPEVVAEQIDKCQQELDRLRQLLAAGVPGTAALITNIENMLKALQEFNTS